MDIPLEHSVRRYEGHAKQRLQEVASKTHLQVFWYACSKHNNNLQICAKGLKQQVPLHEGS